MNRGRILRRRFSKETGRFEKTVEGAVGEGGAVFVRNAWNGLMRGRKTLNAFESAVLRNYRANSGLYLAGVIAFIGLVIAKAIFDYERERV